MTLENTVPDKQDIFTVTWDIRIRLHTLFFLSTSSWRGIVQLVQSGNPPLMHLTNNKKTSKTSFSTQQSGFPQVFFVETFKFKQM